MPFPTHSEQYVRIYNEYKVKREGELEQKIYIKSQICNSRASH